MHIKQKISSLPSPASPIPHRVLRRKSLSIAFIIDNCFTINVSWCRFLSEIQIHWASGSCQTRCGAGKSYGRRRNNHGRYNICCMPGPFFANKILQGTDWSNFIAEPGCFRTMKLHSDLQNQQNNLLAWLRFLPPSRPTGNWKDPVLNVIHTDKRATGAQAWRATVTEQTQRSPCNWDVLVQKGELKKICTRVTEEREMEWI